MPSPSPDGNTDSPEVRPAEATRLFRWLFGSVMDFGAKLEVFSLPSKRAEFFDSPDEAAERAVELADNDDVYFGVWSLHSVPTRGRGTAEGVGAVVCTWADSEPGSCETARLRIEHALGLSGTGSERRG